jgi:hypothetical protein
VHRKWARPIYQASVRRAPKATKLSLAYAPLLFGACMRHHGLCMTSNGAQFLLQPDRFPIHGEIWGHESTKIAAHASLGSDEHFEYLTIHTAPDRLSKTLGLSWQPSVTCAVPRQRNTGLGRPHTLCCWCQCCYYWNRSFRRILITFAVAI